MPPDGERSLHSAIRATLSATSAPRKSTGAGASAIDRASSDRPLALSCAMATRRDSRMRVRIGAARVAIRLGVGCGLFQDSFHPLEALLDLIDRVGIRQPEVARSRLAKGRTGKNRDTALE